MPSVLDNKQVYTTQRLSLTPRVSYEVPPRPSAVGPCLPLQCHSPCAPPCHSSATVALWPFSLRGTHHLLRLEGFLPVLTHPRSHFICVLIHMSPPWRVPHPTSTVLALGLHCSSITFPHCTEQFLGGLLRSFANCMLCLLHWSIHSTRPALNCSGSSLKPTHANRGRTHSEPSVGSSRSGECVDRCVEDDCVGEKNDRFPSAYM